MAGQPEERPPAVCSAGGPGKGSLLSVVCLQLLRGQGLSANTFTYPAKRQGTTGSGCWIAGLAAGGQSSLEVRACTTNAQAGHHDCLV